MRSMIPERFVLVRLLKEDRYAKVFLANDDLLGRENVVVRIISKERIRYSGDRLFEFFSWWIGIQHPEFASVFDAGLTKQQHLYFVREYLPQSQLFSLDSVAMIRRLLSAVSFLSQQNRIHGAIKPTNIFATKEV